jgi:hypothetical protein
MRYNTGAVFAIVHFASKIRQSFSTQKNHSRHSSSDVAQKHMTLSRDRKWQKTTGQMEIALGKVQVTVSREGNADLPTSTVLNVSQYQNKRPVFTSPPTKGNQPHQYGNVCRSKKIKPR